MSERAGEACNSGQKAGDGRIVMARAQLIVRARQRGIGRIGGLPGSSPREGQEENDSHVGHIVGARGTEILKQTAAANGSARTPAAAEWSC